MERLLREVERARDAYKLQADMVIIERNQAVESVALVEKREKDLFELVGQMTAGNCLRLRDEIRALKD